jgi:hypothetical protein
MSDMMDEVAGFAVGAQVVIDDAEYLAERKLYNEDIPDVLTVRRPRPTEIGASDLDLVWFEGQPWAAYKYRVKLASALSDTPPSSPPQP